jgi:Ni,Fe-hydrogenase III small subunit/NAD-dependent dihydropyrimidine dehydrogenase PreA subunit
VQSDVSCVTVAQLNERPQETPMFKSIAVRVSQGTQYIPDPRKANPVGFRGKPVIGAGDCAAGCDACVASCPTAAITLDPVAIDLGRCVLCGDCEPACPGGRISFTNDFRLAATDRSALVVSQPRPNVDPIEVSAALRKRFGRSLKLRSVSAGGCNGCELEVNALTNVNFDIGRYGIDIVASPRHADGLVLTGAITRNMVEALQLCWDGMPDPKLVIAVGACAISGSPFEGSTALDRGFLDRFAPTLYVPGCPPHPLTFVCGVLDVLGIPS